MSRKKAVIKISGITENNLKNIDFSAETGEVVVITGISGSGKSTLVNLVVATEAKRQSMMRRKSDDLYDYTIRPAFKKTTSLPEPVIISQRAIFQSVTSTFGTRTSLNDLLVRLFVNCGEIHYQGKQIVRPDLSQILKFRQKYYPKSQLLGRISHYENISRSQITSLLKRVGIERVLIRNESSQSINNIDLNKLPTTGLSRYEVFIDLGKSDDIEGVLKKTRAVPILIDKSFELDCHEHGFSLDDGKIFRLPTKLLFSRSAMSSRSGCCLECNGAGSVTAYDSMGAIDKKAIIKNGFLKVPLTAAGRYKGFKFLPSGLIKLLLKEGVDISKNFTAISSAHKTVILNILNDKLSRNQKDPVAQQFLMNRACQACEGSGLSWQARAVTVNGKCIDFFLKQTSYELAKELLALAVDTDVTDKALTILGYISNLSIEHIALDRSVTTMSSGELQRMKLLSALVNQYSNKIIVLDEPSSNLQYKDNLKILRLINELKANNNCIVIVDHNPVFQAIADRRLKVGPGAGVDGGEYCDTDDLSQSVKLFDAFNKSDNSIKKYSFKTVPLRYKRNVHLDKIRIPKNVFTAVIGSSGSGKSTLCRELIYPALSESDNVIFFDSKPARGSSSSIVATYLNVFDKVRQYFSKHNKAGLSDSDFSFNSSGACNYCHGRGYVDKHVCGVCFGSRFKPEIALFKAEGKSITELLASDLNDIPLDGGLYFLNETVQVLQQLSLSHINLGRETTSLSGGELQRLKLAKFIIANKKTQDKKGYYIILDEPCSGLDPESVKHLYQALKVYLRGSTVLVIEHNPHFIYKCQYLIDMGEASGVKDKNSIVQGALGEKIFPSLNHLEVLTEAFRLKKGDETQSHRTEVRIEDDEPRALNGKRFDLIPSSIIKQKNFSLELKFSKGFEVDIQDDNTFFYRDKDVLEQSLIKENDFLFNPFLTLLERYSIVPLSLCKEIIRNINKETIVCDLDSWQFKVRADSFEEAYVKGGGVVIVPKAKNKYEYHGVRLLSIKERVIDKVFPHSFAFNLYKNSCEYCNGYGHIQSYPLTEWINRKYSVLNDGFMQYPLYKVIPKATIKKFSKEGLFDFSQPVNKLSVLEFNILLYGFKAYKFMKPGKTDNTEASFFEWRGINSYFYRNATKLSPDEDLTPQLKWKTCPFCMSGFSRKSTFYTLNGQTLPSFFCKENEERALHETSHNSANMR